MAWPRAAAPPITPTAPTATPAPVRTCLRLRVRVVTDMTASPTLGEPGERVTGAAQTGRDAQLVRGDDLAERHRRVGACLAPGRLAVAARCRRGHPRGRGAPHCRAGSR